MNHMNQNKYQLADKILFFIIGNGTIQEGLITRKTRRDLSQLRTIELFHE